MKCILIKAKQKPFTEDFQYNKLLEETIKSDSRLYKMEKSNNQKEHYILKITTCRIVKSERELSFARESIEILKHTAVI